MYTLAYIDTPVYTASWTGLRETRRQGCYCRPKIYSYPRTAGHESQVDGPSNDKVTEGRILTVKRRDCLVSNQALTVYEPTEASQYQVSRYWHQHLFTTEYKFFHDDWCRKVSTPFFTPHPTFLFFSASYILVNLDIRIRVCDHMFLTRFLFPSFFTHLRQLGRIVILLLNFLSIPRSSQPLSLTKLIMSPMTKKILFPTSRLLYATLLPHFPRRRTARM